VAGVVEPWVLFLHHCLVLVLQGSFSKPLSTLTAVRNGAVCGGKRAQLFFRFRRDQSLPVSCLSIVGELTT